MSHEDAQGKVLDSIANLSADVKTLLSISQAHERRLGTLEDRQAQSASVNWTAVSVLLTIAALAGALIMTQLTGLRDAGTMALNYEAQVRDLEVEKLEDRVAFLDRTVEELKAQNLFEDRYGP